MMRYIPILATLIIIFSCAKIDFVKDVKYLTHKHQSVAIILPGVHMGHCEELTDDEYAQAQVAQSENLLSHLYKEIYNKNANEGYKVKIKDKRKTLEILKREGLDALSTEEFEKICEVLEVDALIIPDFELDQPTEETYSTVRNILRLGTRIPIGGSTYGLPFSSSNKNQMTAEIQLFDKATSKIIWKYGGENSQKFKGKEGQKKKLMKQIAKSLPYFHSYDSKNATL